MLFRVLCLLFVCALCFADDAKLQDDSSPSSGIVVQFGDFFNPNDLDNYSTKVLIRFMRNNPEIQIRRWGGISLPGGKSGLMMAIAGNTAPDIGLSWFHIIQNEIKQEFLYPLNEWIGDDTNGNGMIDDDEAKWEGWKKIPLIMRRVATRNGKVYGLPLAEKTISSIIFRTDMVEAAGLDPNKPPKTWGELAYWCCKLTDSQKKIVGSITNQGQKGILLPVSGWQYIPWIQTQGGEPIIQIRKDPATGKSYSFGQNEMNFIVKEDGKTINLSKEPSVWRANLDCPESLNALDFLYNLRWGRWVTTKDKTAITVEEAKKQGIEFDEKDVYSGIARSASASQTGEGDTELLSRAEIAMFLTVTNYLDAIGTSANIDPALLSWFPYPAAPGPKGTQVVQTQNHYAVMYPGVRFRPKAERDACWKALVAVTDPKNRDINIESMVLKGMARFVKPNDLKRLGYEEYLRDIPKVVQDNFEGMESGRIKTFTEPWTGFWFLIDMAMNNQCLGLILGARGLKYNPHEQIRIVNTKANSGMMFDTPEEVLSKWRPLAAVVCVLMLCLCCFLGYKIVQSYMKKKTGGSRSVYKGYLPILLILPAMLLIIIWNYYPLVRGMILAFQDYKVSGDSQFVGLDNFINLAIDRSFWMSMWRTCYYVMLNMLLAFFAPIVLSIMLTEIKRFKIFYRTLFFLPQMTSGLVIALLWKLMYNPTPAGFFNQMIDYFNMIPFVHIEHQAWLQDPSLAMLCCIIPSVWSGMGMASLIYLAALHSIPTELYEAAAVDGAGFRRKLWNVTIPCLLPLIIINFVGTFIGTFQNMGNIFLMTFGGPGEATTVVGLKIWIEAYVNLRFGMATSMACILGSLLIGLTYFQIQFLSKIEYKRAAD